MSKPFWRAWVRRVGVVFVPIVIGYGVVFLNPQLLFAYEARASNVVLHARTPLPPEAQHVADSVRDRLMQSPFYDATDVYDVYLCDTAALFGFFALHDYRVGGVAQVYLTGNVFLRPSRIERDRLLGPSGREAQGDRTLTYFITHELTHIATARRLGRLRYHRLERWQQEGYADYIGKGGRNGSFDFGETLSAFRAGARELDPARSGLYLRYHLLVAYLLDHTDMTAEALLSESRDQNMIERQLP